MQKYLSVPMSGTNETNQLLKMGNLIMCKTVNTTTTEVDFSGPDYNGKAIFTHTAMAANDHSMRIAITDAMAAAYKTSYTNAVYELPLSTIITAAGAPVTVSNIAVS